MKENNLQPRLLYPARISFKYEGEIKSFTDKQNLREFSTTKIALQQMLKGFLDLGDYFLPHFREVFNYYLLQYFLRVFLFVFFFWDSYD